MLKILSLGLLDTLSGGCRAAHGFKKYRRFERGLNVWNRTHNAPGPHPQEVRLDPQDLPQPPSQEVRLEP